MIKNNIKSFIDKHQWPLNEGSNYYASEGYIEINEALRSSRLDQNVLDFIRDIYKDITEHPETWCDEIISDLVLFRGVTHDLSHIKVGDSIIERGFMSTALVRDEALAFAYDTFFEIHIKEPTNLLFLSPTEMEILMLPFVHMTVTKIKTEKYPSQYGCWKQVYEEKDYKVIVVDAVHKRQMMWEELGYILNGLE